MLNVAIFAFYLERMHSPRNGEIARIMRSTLSRYHYAIRFVKKNEEIMRKNAMAHCIAENKYRDLWKEVHKVRSKSRVGSQCMVDDVTRNENITQLFAHKYDVLYNSVCSNSDEMSNLLYMNQADIESVCLQLNNDSHEMINRHTHTVSVKHIQDAIHKLQSAKSDCRYQLLSDHFMNGTVRFFTLISWLYTCMLTYMCCTTRVIIIFYDSCTKR